MEKPLQNIKLKKNELHNTRKGKEKKKVIGGKNRIHALFVCPHGHGPGKFYCFCLVSTF